MGLLEAAKLIQKQDHAGPEAAKVSPVDREIGRAVVVPRLVIDKVGPRSKAGELLGVRRWNEDIAAAMKNETGDIAQAPERGLVVEWVEDEKSRGEVPTGHHRHRAKRRL